MPVLSREEGVAVNVPGWVRIIEAAVNEGRLCTACDPIHPPQYVLPGIMTLGEFELDPTRHRFTRIYLGHQLHLGVAYGDERKMSVWLVDLMFPDAGVREQHFKLVRTGVAAEVDEQEFAEVFQAPEENLIAHGNPKLFIRAKRFGVTGLYLILRIDRLLGQRFVGRGAVPITMPARQEENDELVQTRRLPEPSRFPPAAPAPEELAGPSLALAAPLCRICGLVVPKEGLSKRQKKKMKAGTGYAPKCGSCARTDGDPLYVSTSSRSTYVGQSAPVIGLIQHDSASFYPQIETERGMIQHAATAFSYMGLPKGLERHLEHLRSQLNGLRGEAFGPDTSEVMMERAILEIEVITLTFAHYNDVKRGMDDEISHEEGLRQLQIISNMSRGQVSYPPSTEELERFNFLWNLVD